MASHRASAAVPMDPSPATAPRLARAVNAVTLRPASVADARTVAELIAIAGEGIPVWLWGRSAKDGQDPLDVGTERAARPDAHFSFRNAVLAQRGGQVAGMMLGYRLDAPTAADVAGLGDLPDLLRPLVELEHQAPGSFYINALAVFEGHRDSGVGTRLLEAASGRAAAIGCTQLSVQVFSQNNGAVRLYARNGFRTVDSRPIVAHPSYRYDERVLLMKRVL